MTTLERQSIRQPSHTPTTKVAASGNAGAISVLLVFVLGKFDNQNTGRRRLRHHRALLRGLRLPGA
ncbi:Uncharacterised protein [Mycobacteroides abscessus subsp. massiliense]|nr:Uncharacterised protein [Mycobacteroides abscessus subsp. massiliense]SLC88485.1 Uncharacterised protein [Mycobacteroides abscessus subsp. massiliense]